MDRMDLNTKRGLNGQHPIHCSLLIIPNMKQLLLLISFLVLSTCSQAQSIADIPVQKVTSKYAKVIAIRSNSVGKYTIFISIGQAEPMRDRKGTPVKDASGNLIEMDTPVRALNMLDELGYELLKAYTQEADNSEHFLLKKRG